MFDLGWSELLLIGIVALIVVGPKDLPMMFRTLGRMTGKARAMARDFSRAMEDAADDSGVRDISKTIRAAANPKAFGTDKLRDAAGLRDGFKPGGETAKLSADREETRRKIAESTAKAATERKARDAEPLPSIDDESAADLEHEPISAPMPSPVETTSDIAPEAQKEDAKS